MTIPCHTCGKLCKDFKELAFHIREKANRKTHPQGWAKHYIKEHVAKQNYLDRKLSMRKLERTPLTDEDRIAKEDTRRELSGDTKVVPTICPRCKTGNRQTLEAEHTDNPLAWRIGIAFVKMCINCNGGK